MNRIQILNEIKAQFKKMMFAEEFANLTTPYTTTDGKNIIVMGEDLTEGVEIYQVDDNNVQSPLENGDYTLQDGRLFTVTDNIVSSVTAPDPAQATESPVAPAKMEMGDGMPDGQLNSGGETPEDVIAEGEVESRISALEQQVQELMQMLQGTMTQTEKMMSSHIEMSETVKKIASEPDGKKVTTGKKLIQDNQTISNFSMDEIREIGKRMNSVKGL